MKEPYSIITTTGELDALPEQSVIVNVNPHEGPLDMHDVFQKVNTDLWGGYGFIYTQTTQELAMRYLSGFYVVFNPREITKGEG